MTPRTLGAAVLHWRLFQFGRQPYRAFSIAFVDMDGLTNVDRDQGRRAATRLLEAMVSCIRAGIGPKDRLFRYGGDEYVCVFADADPARTSAVLEEARRRLLDRCRMRFSFGIATSRPTHTAYSLMKEAEARMLFVRSLERGGERRC
jgi:GGDEF domain-containing protein